MAVTQNLIDGWSLMTTNEALKSVEEHLAKVRAEADEKEIHDAEETIKLEIAKAVEAGDRNYFFDEEKERRDAEKKKLDDYFETKKD